MAAEKTLLVSCAASSLHSILLISYDTGMARFHYILFY